ncbi:MAG: alpha/beta hydrolase [Opitutae bacterium]|nr:alpha/beta hydrolase [Opitutae bacterium]
MTWLVRSLVLLGAGAALTAIAHLVSGRLMFLPDYGSRRAPEGMIRIPSVGGGSLAALYLPNPAAKHTLWFFHGNAEDLGDLEPFLHEMHRRGFAVFAVDYPGYGLSTGTPSESAVYEATDTAARYLQDTLRVPPARTILYGRSLGGGPAVELAAHERVAGLVLQSAFMSAYRTMTRWRLVPFDKFENLRKLPRLTCPILVMHGREDEVVSFAHGEALAAAAPGPKSHLWVDGAHHNDLVDFAGERYWHALREFSRRLATD